jgi:hypothetical protein
MTYYVEIDETNGFLLSQSGDLIRISTWRKVKPVYKNRNKYVRYRDINGKRRMISVQKLLKKYFPDTFPAGI